MPPDPGSTPKPGDLQFDQVVPAAGESTGAKSCSVCKKPIESEYFHAGAAQQVVCPACRARVEQQLAEADVKRRSAAATVRASIFGLGAAIAGAVVYYAVIKITRLEIALVAILIGYMVGWAVRKGSVVGGLRFQLLAVGLTYFAIGLAYAPLATASSGGGAALSPIALIGHVLALPVMVVIGSGASGILSVIIIGVGLRQAWRMTGAPKIEFRGPYKLKPAAAG